MKIIIIGNGISGVTLARNIRKKSDHEVVIISKETKHFFSRTALMYVYMGHMRASDLKPYEDGFWAKNRIDLIQDEVVSIDYNNKKLTLKNESHLSYDKLILATGSTPNKFGWPGQDLNRVSGLYSMQDLEYIEACSRDLKQAVIVGGGLIGLELAEMFHARNIPVTMLVREKSYWDVVMPKEESMMIGKHILEHHIDMRLETELKEIIDDGQGNACAVITSKGDRIDCGYVGLTAGVHPNIGFLRDGELEIGRGIKVNEFLETNIADVYAIGDCAEQKSPQSGRRPIEAVWYTGKMMGETLANTICGEATSYDPGIWWNSAKFLDIEYQVYGTVLAQPPAHHASLYWEYEDGKKSIRIVYDNRDNTIIGFNLMGIRYRHQVCEKWIAEKASMETVLSNIPLANFDPEFYKSYEADLIALYNKQTGKNIQLKKSRSWDQVFSFLTS